MELRNTKELKTRKHEEELKPYIASMTLIENVLMEEINRLEGQSIKTQFGTAYRSTVTSFRVADREIWLDFVFNGNHRDFLTANVSKDAVKDWMEEKDETPPGLNVTQLYRMNIRAGEPT